MPEKLIEIGSRRGLARYLVQVVGPVCSDLSGERLPGPRLGWRFIPERGCDIGLWVQIENWGRAFRLDDAKRAYAIRLEAGVGRPGPDMYEHASLTHGTVTLMNSVDRETRELLAQESWRTLRSVVGDDVADAAVDELALNHRVEEDDSFYPVRAERDVDRLVSVLAAYLPRMLAQAASRARTDG